jgi:predicted permease
VTTVRLLPNLASPSLRMLGRHRRFSALAIVSLGVAIALNTSMYGVLDAMIRPRIEMRSPEQLYLMPYFGDFRRLIPLHERNQAIREGLRFHDGVTGTRRVAGEGLVQRGARLREALVVAVLPNYFQLLGVRATAGRLLTASDLTTSPQPVVIGERMWKQLFPEMEEFEPSPILVNGEPRVVVGLISYRANIPGVDNDVWMLPPAAAIDSIPLDIVRLRPTVTPAQAEAELVMLAGRFAQRTRENTREAGFRFRAATRPPYRANRFHWALTGAVISVLLIACANLANLQLARGVSRARELATRSAVGASRRQIVAHLFIESGWLALGGLLLAAVLTWWGMRIIDASVPATLEGYVTRPQVSWRVLVFAIGATLFSLLLVGLAPAMKLSRVDIGQVLKNGAGTGKSRSTRRQYGVLVVVEVALALALLASTSLLLRAAFETHAFTFGHEYRRLATTFVAFQPAGPRDTRSARDWSEEVVRRARLVPGVVSAATHTWRAPPRRAISVDAPGGAPTTYSSRMLTFQVISPDYLRTRQIPIVQGRDFSQGEFGEPLIVVDERTADFFWPGLDPVGRRVKLDSGHTSAPWLRVIGVAANTRDWIPNDRDEDEARARSRRGMGVLYLLNAGDTARLLQSPHPRRYTSSLRLVVRTEADPISVLLPLRRTLQALGPNTLVAYPRTWEQTTGIAQLRARHDFMAGLFVVFGVFALSLAAMGVYAIIAHMVAQRTREFGVRIAVGAGERQIRELVLREGNVLTLTGIALGLLLTWKNAALVREFVFSDYDRYDSRVFALASLVIFAVAWLASYIPARRAMRINPTEALRND